jgi:hypothetical protein
MKPSLCTLHACRRAGSTSHEDRAVARRLLLRLRRRARPARRPLARAPGRCRLRLRHLLAGDCAPTAQLHRNLDRNGGIRPRAPRLLGAPVHRAVSELRERRRLACRRVSEAAPLGEALHRDRARGPAQRPCICRHGSEKRESFASRRRADSTFHSRSTEHWLTILDAADVPAGPINDVETALADPQVVARDAIESYEHARFGEVRRVRSPLRLSGEQPAAARRPWRGEHTRTALETICGIGSDELDELERQGAFGQAAVSQTP